MCVGGGGGGRGTLNPQPTPADTNITLTSLFPYFPEKNISELYEKKVKSAHVVTIKKNENSTK